MFTDFLSEDSMEYDDGEYDIHDEHEEESDSMGMEEHEHAELHEEPCQGPQCDELNEEPSDESVVLQLPKHLGKRHHWGNDRQVPQCTPWKPVPTGTP